MNELMNFDDVNNRIITLRNQNVMLDVAVAELYGVQTKEINQAIRNNPDKFPEGYTFELTPSEKQEVIENPNISVLSKVVKNFDHLNSTHSMAYLDKIKLSPTLPKAFTEKGLYMLATILKSPQATRATLEIVEAFAKMRELSRNIAMLSTMEPEVIEPETIESTGGLLSNLLFSHLPTISSETSLEFNIGIMKGKKTIRSDNNALQNEINELKKMMITMNKKLEML